MFVVIILASQSVGSSLVAEYWEFKTGALSLILGNCQLFTFLCGSKHLYLQLH